MANLGHGPLRRGRLVAGLSNFCTFVHARRASLKTKGRGVSFVVCQKVCGQWLQRCSSRRGMVLFCQTLEVRFHANDSDLLNRQFLWHRREREGRQRTT